MRRHVPPLDPSMIQTYLMVIALVTVLGIGVAILDRLRKGMIRPTDEPKDVPEFLRNAFESGAMEEEEYRRVREVLERPRAAPSDRDDPNTLPP